MTEIWIQTHVRQLELDRILMPYRNKKVVNNIARHTEASQCVKVVMDVLLIRLSLFNKVNSSHPSLVCCSCKRFNDGINVINQLQEIGYISISKMYTWFVDSYGSIRAYQHCHPLEIIFPISSSTACPYLLKVHEIIHA